MAGHTRVLVALPNLDLWTPAIDPSVEIVREANGLGAEMHFWDGTIRFAPIMTAVFYERWADCRQTSVSGTSCVAMHARRRLRATTRADLSVPGFAIRPNVRSRAAVTTTSALELVPDLILRDGQLQALETASWVNCETTGALPCPTIPNMMFSTPF